MKTQYQFTDNQVDRMLKSYLIDVQGFEFESTEQNNIGDSLGAIVDPIECIKYMGLTDKGQINQLFY